MKSLAGGLNQRPLRELDRTDGRRVVRVRTLYFTTPERSPAAICIAVVALDGIK
jgi:hypothetical protein